MDPTPTSPNSHGAGRGLLLLCLRNREPSLEVLRNEAGYEADGSLNQRSDKTAASARGKFS